MARAIEILAMIDQGLAENKRAEYKDVLSKHPLKTEEVAFAVWELP